MKKQWFMAGLAAGVLALAITGGTVLAQSNDTSGTSPIKSFAGRVAEKLGLQEAQVQDAMKQTRKEMQSEALKNRLDKAVSKGHMTQDQADQMYNWYEARPDIAGEHGMGMGRFGGPHSHGHGEGHGHRSGDDRDMHEFGSGQSPAQTTTPTTQGFGV